MPQHRLTIYEASAGSGKTFTLALEYIRLLIDNPENYRYILAVTFTNKATDEMKQRILKRLFGLANGLADSEDYLRLIAQSRPHLDEKVIRERAQMALQNITHHYHYFRVMTIDSFFQLVMRGLARELGLTANLTVDLRQEEMESMAVDRLVESINDDKDQLLAWLLDFVSQQMEEGRSWNVIEKIKSFGVNIFKEIYQMHAQHLVEFKKHPDAFKHYEKSLRNVVKEADNMMKEESAAFVQAMNQRGIKDADFSRASSNAPAYYARLSEGIERWTDEKMPNNTIRKIIDGEAKNLIRSADRDSEKGKIIQNIVPPMLAATEVKRKEQVARVLTAKLTLGQIKELQLLDRIEEEVRKLNEETNSRSLDSTKKLLADLIKGSDAPFIYEKIGGQLKYIMIDEFQDTSVVQWKNFEVLLRECMSHHKGSLIVGDVKQSIYRWRSGDWQILQHLVHGGGEAVEAKPLDYNFRSDPYVVCFNNDFFTHIAPLAEEMVARTMEINLQQPSPQVEVIKDIGRVYANVYQKSPSGKEDKACGAVHVRFAAKQSSNQSFMADMVARALQELLEAGVPRQSIAVLARSNSQIQELATWFQQHTVTVHGKEQRVRMVSDQAFRLDASSIVMNIVNAMRFLLQPSDLLTLRALTQAWSLHGETDNSPLPLLQKEVREQLLHLSLTDMALQLHHLLHLDKCSEEDAYVCAFMDQVLRFVKENSSDLTDFLVEWDKSIHSSSIQSSDIDGVRMLTIHKSKGLEYEYIIMAQCTWKMELPSSLLWVRPQVAPFSQLKFLPVRLYSSQLKRSLYRDDYLQEYVMNVVDSLNMLYVGFTRAKYRLYVLGTYDVSSPSFQLIRSTLTKMGEVRPCYRVEDNEEEKSLQMDFVAEGMGGEVRHPSATISQVDSTPSSDSVSSLTNEGVNVFDVHETLLPATFASYPLQAVFLQSNDSRAFVSSDEEEQSSWSHINTGNIIHALLSQLRTVDDLPRALNDLHYDGWLYGEEWSREQLETFLQSQLSHPEVAEWFAPQWQVLNERPILYRNEEGELHQARPDRVVTNGMNTLVIDFKTGEPRPSHHQQVLHYMNLLQQMGYPHVEGRLWYLKDNRIVKIKV